MSKIKKTSILLIITITLGFLAACASNSLPLITASPPGSMPTATSSTIPPTNTPIPTDTPLPSPTPQRTPPALPQVYQSTALNPLDYPHMYLNDTCDYLRMKWDPNNSAPGTIVMAIMFHSILKDEATYADKISASDFKQLMNTLKEQGFEAITTEQLVNFLETNTKIPSRSVILIVDDRHYAQYFNTYFRPYWEEYGWPVVNAWISHPETWASLWQENESLASEGWVDYQAHGVIHNIYISDYSTDEFILNELQGSITAIQEHFGKTPTAFIWPGGGFTARGVQLARESGYRIGFTINPRGPIMFNWIPIADVKDPMRENYLVEGPVHDPLMVLPRYWPSQIMTEIDKVRLIGKEAAAYAEQNKQSELEFYEIMCSPTLEPIPQAAP